MAKKKASNKKRSKYEIMKRPSKSECLDPKLEVISNARKEGKVQKSVFVFESASGEQFVNVVVRLYDPTIEIPDLKILTKAGSVITARVNVEDLEAIAEHDNVLRLEQGRRVYQDLHDSVPEIHATPIALSAALPTGAMTPTGRGVIVGIVDFGCDFLHQNFRRADGSTRILSLWDQNGASSVAMPAPQPYDYGRELSADVINNALAMASDPPAPELNMLHPDDFNNVAYQTLAYRPSFPVATDGNPAHGTHVADIASGNGNGSGFPGVAPAADIIFVDLGSGDNDPARTSFGDSVQLIHAVDYIFTMASELGRPAVVNMSLGTHGGPHDGSTAAEEYFEFLLQEMNRAIVLSAGNARERRIHASGTVTDTKSRSLTWQIRTTTGVDNEVEVWYDGNTELQVTVIDPENDGLGSFPLGSEVDIHIAGESLGTIRHRKDVVNGDNFINVYLKQNGTLPSGKWRIELEGVNQQPVDFHAWIERVGANVQSKFASQDADPTHTIGSISCGQNTIAVGCYNARAFDTPIASFSAEGPTRDGKSKPEVSAPGGEVSDGVLAARSLTHRLRTAKAGTSMAAPHVTGLIALMMEIADQPLSIDDIRAALFKNLRSNPVDNDSEWHSRFGFGRIDAAATCAQLASSQPSTPLNTQAKPATLEPVLASTINGILEEGVLAQIAHTAVQSNTKIRVQIEAEPIETSWD